MITLEQIIKEVQKETGYDEQSVTVVCRHPFNFTEKKMKDDDNTLAILFHGLFKFKLKNKFLKLIQNGKESK